MFYYIWKWSRSHSLPRHSMAQNVRMNEWKCDGAGALAWRFAVMCTQHININSSTPTQNKQIQIGSGSLGGRSMLLQLHYISRTVEPMYNSNNKQKLYADWLCVLYCGRMNTYIYIHKIPDHELHLMFLSRSKLNTKLCACFFSLLSVFRLFLHFDFIYSPKKKKHFLFTISHTNTMHFLFWPNIDNNKNMERDKHEHSWAADLATMHENAITTRIKRWLMNRISVFDSCRWYECTLIDALSFAFRSHMHE